jgi:class 3 adenylate cyclase
VDARTGYAKTPDGAHIAYSIIGGGDIDLLRLAPFTISIDSLDDEPGVAHYFRRLGAFARIVRFDARGVGLSDPIDPTRPRDVDSLAAEAEAVLDATTGERPVALLGDVGGGPIALELAATMPDRFSALVLVNGYARLMSDPPEYPIGIPRDVLDGFLEENTDPDAEWDVGGSDDVALMTPSRADDLAYREWWARSSRRGASPASARALISATTHADKRHRLAEITVPTLVLHARRSAFIPPPLGRYVAEHVAGAKAVEINTGDILPFGEAADPIADEIEEFLTGRRSGGVERVLATVLFTDIVDSTGRAAALGDRAWRGLLDRHDAIVRAQLSRFGGREVNTTGDGFLGAFDAPTRAVQCARAIVAATAAEGIAVRAGVHTGECERRGDDLAGLTVNIAARVAAEAASGEVLVSRTVRDLVVGSEIRLVDKGAHELKGVPETWQLFAVEP